MWGYIFGGAIIAGFAAYHGNIVLMLGAFVVFCGLRIYEDRLNQRWIPILRSIIEKYEASATVNDNGR